MPKTMDYRKDFESLFAELSFAPQKVFKNGPRVYVAGGSWGQKRAVFKAPCGGDLHATSAALEKEAIFLQNLPQEMQNLVAGIFQSGRVLGERFWYLVEWVDPGEVQTTGESDFLVKSTLFTHMGGNWACLLLRALRRLARQVPPKIEALLAKTAYRFASYRGLLESAGAPFFAAQMPEIKHFLDAAAQIYDRFNRSTIVHHEFYGSQILSTRDSFKLSDWENVGWGNPLRDFTSLWLRGFAEPAWQKEFLEKFRAEVLGEGVLSAQDFEILFGVEKILQGFGNLAYLSGTEIPSEQAAKEAASDFFRREILDLLSP